MRRKVLPIFIGIVSICGGLLLLLLLVCIALPPVGMDLLMMGCVGIRHMGAGINHLSVGHIEKAGPMPESACTENPIAYKDGHILFFCGEYKSSLLYEPITGRYSQLNFDLGFKTPAHEGRGYSLTPLPDEKLLLIGGSDQSNIIEEKEPRSLFLGVSDIKVRDPGATAFRTIGHLQKARYGHNSVLLNTGKILVLGGETLAPRHRIGSKGDEDIYEGNVRIKKKFNDGDVIHVSVKLDTAELVDPKTGESTLLPNPMLIPRSGSKPILLKDGRVLVMGGITTGPDNKDQFKEPSIEIFDPQTLTFTPAGKLPPNRSLGEATLLPQGQVLISSFLYSPGTAEKYFVEIYDPLTQHLSPLKEPQYPLRGHAIVLENGKVLIAGNPPGFFDSWAPLELFEPKTRSFKFIGNASGSPLVALPNRRVLLYGMTPNKEVSTNIYAY
jgi:hypothetical protein